VLVATVLCGAAAVPPATASEAGFTIDREDGRVVVQATDADIEDVVADLGRQAGFDVTVLTGAERSPVNGTISGDSVPEVVRKLLRRRNYTLFYDAGGRKIDQVVLLSPPSEKRWVPTANVSTADRRQSQRQRQVQAQRLRERRARQRKLQARRAAQARRK